MIHKDVLKALLEAKDRTLESLQAMDPALAKAVIALSQAAPGEGPKDGRAQGDILGPTDVIGAHPVLAMHIARAQVEEVASLAGLPAASGPRPKAAARGAAFALAEATPTLTGIDGAALSRWVREKKLTLAQAAEVELCAALYALVDDDAKVAKAIRGAALSRLGGEAPASTRDLARLSAADWTAFFRSPKAALPAGATPESAGASLAARLAALHPSVALLARFPTVSDAPRNEDLPSLRSLSSAYPGLDLGSVLGDKRLDHKAKVKAITRRIQLVQGAGERLGDAHVQDLDLRTGSPDLQRLGLEELRATAAEKRMVISLFQGLQRVWALSKDVDDTHALLRKGFTSALSIAKAPLASFERASGLDAKKARRIWDKARSALSDVTLAVGAIVDVKSGLFDKIQVGNLAPSATEHLKELPGVAELFGSLSYCECEECQSILGPAAYFVDLMKFIDEHLRSQLAGHPDHPLDLKTRRPDLWTLDLGCKDIEERIPTLDIVNEILERDLARRAGFQGSFTDLGAVREFVYGQTLSQPPQPPQPPKAQSSSLPFHLQLTRIRSYLSALGHTRDEVAVAVGGRSPDAALASGASVDEQGGAAALDALVESGYSPDDVAAAVGRSPKDVARSPDTEKVAQAIVLAARTALTFTQFVFAATLGATEQGSADILASNPGLVESPSAGTWRLRAGVDLAGAAITVPLTAIVATTPSGTRSVTPEEVRGALRPYVAAEVLVRSLGAALGLPTSKVVALFALMGSSLTTAGIVLAVRGDGPIEPLVVAIASLRPLCAALKAPVWDAAAIDFVRERPDLFGAEALPHPAADPAEAPVVSLDQLRALSVYRRIVERNEAKGPHADAATPEDVRYILTEFDSVTRQFSPSADAMIARALGVPASLVSGLRGRAVLPETAALALDRLGRAAALAVEIGVDAESLAAIVSESYATLASAADALLSAIRGRYSDEVARAAKLDEVEQPVREARRDALVDYLLHSIQPKAWSSIDDLHRYFLIDVKAGGCATTSRVVAATMSAQMYVHRALMNLEEGDLPKSPGHLALRMPADAAAEWEWRRSYRVWQANRKVFLWPENYLEPALRGDKTPLFAALEQELLQTDIDDQSVLDAYSKYLAGLQELSSLTIAGAYHDVLSNETGGADHVGDVLHLFGATAADPPVYYYRTCENLKASARDPSVAARFHPWQRLPVQITARKVSPVVHKGRLHVFWLDVRTRPMNRVEGGASQFSGYQHTFSLKLTTLQADGAWTVPQEVRLPSAPDSKSFGPARGQVMDPLWAGVAKLDPQARYQSEPVDDYTLGGPGFCGVWLQPSPDGLSIQLRNFLERDGHVDLFGRRIVPRPPTTKITYHPKLLCARSTAAGSAAAKAVADVRSVAEDANDHIEKARAAAAAAAKVDLNADFNAANNALLGNKGAKAVADANKVIADDLAILNNAALLAKDAAKAEAGSLAAATSAAAVVAFAASSNGRKQQKALHTGAFGWFWSAPALANAVIDEERMDLVDFERPKTKGWLQTLGAYKEQIAALPSNTELLAVPGSEEDGLLQIDNDVLLLQGSVLDGPDYVLRRLGTTLVEETARRLFEDGLDGLLDTQTQLALKEAGIPITLTGDHVVDRSNKGQLDLQGPYGVYYRELFFHIPLLLARALNSRGRFESARRWYHFLFDPTSVEEIDVTGVPAGDVAHRLLDRVWRYRELRGQGEESLRQRLTDADALAAYRRDPFNPWAIAGRRTSALQKAVVMGYVDNLLDWADSLFAQLTMESVNEAMMLYVTASDILGPRPTKIEDCGAGVEPATYEKIGPLVDGTSEVLVELESVVLGARAAKGPSRAALGKGGRAGIDRRSVLQAIGRSLTRAGAISITPSNAPSSPAAEGGERGLFRGLGFNEARTTSFGPALGNAAIRSRDKGGGRSLGPPRRPGALTGGDRLGWSIVRQIARAGEAHKLVFCVPSNPELLACWDRLEDRLYKIRHCMDIDGQRREIALFAPPIDPRQIIAMKAAGLTLDDVLGAGNGDLPPYRFLYLVDRAKAFAASLGGFGTALLSALEKKDIEQLQRLRLTQQLNLAHLTTQTRQLEIQAAEESLEAHKRQREAAVYRREFYETLLREDRNAWEIAEAVGRHTVSGLRGGAAALSLLAGVAGLLPQLGSPFASKYGGVEFTNSITGFAQANELLATMADSLAASAGLEGNLARRREGWKNQRTLAEHDIRSLDRQIKAASIRLDIANRGKDAHEKSLDQMQELLDATDEKLTSLGLYTWLSGQLQGAYRSAYRNALALARLAEQAFRFERGADPSSGLAASYWEPARAGLLAGERLLVDLQTLERRFLETNYRALEVDQAFALSQIDARALVDLRATGECTFTIGEAFFDLFYPGHYKRRIKAVRLTLPCITGPYVNVSATLRLERSWLRPAATPGAPLALVPPSRSISIATSTAQNDAGVFELSFRDERYMPFEGLGAISEWRLTLPKAFRQFDHATISDVILSISYSAEQDGALRDRVEAQNKALEGSILSYFSNNVACRLFSLRQDFSSAFTRLLRSAVGSPVKIEISDRNLPMFFRGRELQVKRGVLLLRTAGGSATAGVQLTVDGATIGSFSPDPTLGELPAQALPGAFTAHLRGTHTLVLVAAGDLAPTAPPPGDTSAIDGEKLLDVLLYVEYQLA